MMTPDEWNEFHELLTSVRFDVQEIMQSKKRFREVHNRLYGYMKMGFEEDRVRKHPLHYSFDGNTVLTMEVRMFIVNMLCWYPLLKMGRQNMLNDTYIVDKSIVNKKDLIEWFNEKILEPNQDTVSNEKMNMIFEETLFQLGQISLDFNEIMAISVSIYTFQELEDASPEIAEILRHKPDPGMQPVDIEAYQHDATKRLIALMKEIDNEIKPILNAGEGIKDKQLAELVIPGVLKPDINGNTIPQPITSSFLIGGLNTVSNYYIDKQAGRKAVVINKTMMGNAGWFAQKMIRVTKDTKVDFNVEDCGTTHPVLYHVKDKKHLKIIDRSYYATLDDPYTLKIARKKDTFLIGKDILLRTPATCGLGHGRVCKTCYGALHKINSEPEFSHGGYGASKSGNKYQQDTLSVKHVMATNSVQIKFPDLFYDIFTIDTNIVSIIPDKIEDPSRWTLIINEERLVEHDRVEFNSYTSELIIRDNTTGEEHIIEEENGVDIFIYQDAITQFKSKDGRKELDLKKLDGEEFQLGIIVVENNETTKPLKNMRELLDHKNHFGCETVDDMVNTIADLSIKADSGVILVHWAMVIKNLLCRADDIYAAPRFSSYTDNDYRIMTITEALVNNPSIATSLASQELRKQFESPETYKKHGKSSSDAYFRRSLV